MWIVDVAQIPISLAYRQVELARFPVERAVFRRTYRFRVGRNASTEAGVGKLLL